MMDRATKFKRSFPRATRSTPDTVQAFMQFAGPGRKPQRVYHDNAKEFVEASTQLKWLHDTSVTGRSETNGIAERAIEDVRQGTTSALLQAGFFPEHWPSASEYYCIADSIKPDSQGKIAWNEFHGQGDFPAKELIYGQLVYFYPVPSHAKTLPRQGLITHKFRVR